jgi:rhodanese-related sulfurtransferase
MEDAAFMVSVGSFAQYGAGTAFPILKEMGCPIPSTSLRAGSCRSGGWSDKVGVRGPRWNPTLRQNRAKGWATGGYELDYIPQIPVQEFSDLLEKEKDHITVLDVRERGEVEAGAMQNAIPIPLGQLQARTAELDPNKLLVVHCKGGYRSSIATSILRRANFRDIANLTGGFDAWKAMSHTA